MAIDPFTGQYKSPFAPGGALSGLPSFTMLPQENPAGTMLGRAIGRGVDTLQQGLGSAVEGIGSSIGLQGVEAYGADVAARNAAEVARSAAMERPDSGVTGYLASTVGENAPQMGLSVALPAIGAGLGSVVPGLGTGVGFTLGTGASALLNYLLLAGENRERQKQVSPGMDVNEAAAFGAAIPGAALETLSGALGGKILTGALRGPVKPTAFLSRATAANAAKMAGVGAVAEVPTEVGQQFLTRAQAGQNLADREAFGEYFDAGVGAALLGGIAGGAGSALNDYAEVRRSNAAAASNDKLKGAVDQALQLGPTPPLASKLNALVNPEEMMGPLGGVETQLDRPFAKATDADLLTDLAATEQRLATGGATQDDARNLRMLRAELAAREAQVAQPPLPEVDPRLQMFSRGVDALVERQKAQMAEGLSSGEGIPARMVPELLANQDQARELRAEELRQTIDRMNAEDEQRRAPLAKQETKSLRAALKALDEKAKEGPLEPADQTLQRVLQAELAVRAPSPEAKKAAQDELERQGFLFEEMSPQAERARGQVAAQIDATKRRAAKLGLSTNSKFYEALDARTEDELLDRVLDAVDRAERGEVAKGEGNLNTTLSKIAYAIGKDRDLNAEIAKAQAKVEAFGSKDVRTEKGRKAFEQARSDFVALQQVKAKYDAAVARKRLRDAGEGGQTQLPLRKEQMAEQRAPVREGVPAGQAQPLTGQDIADTISRLTVQQEGQPSLLAAREMPAQVAPGTQIELPGLRALPEQQAPVREGTPIVPENILETAPQPQEQLPLRPGPVPAPAASAAPIGGLGERLLAAGVVPTPVADAAARKDRDFAAALGQRLEQQAPAAEAQAAAIQAEPDRVVSDVLKGTENTITFAKSEPVVLKYEKGAWYSAGKFLARKLSDAKKVALAQKSDIKPLYRAARHVADDVALTSGVARLAAVQDAVAKATRGWKGGNQVVVVQNFDAMPEAAKMLFPERAKAADISGAYMGDGTVYVFADKILSRAEAVATVFHEVLGHRGLRAAFNKDRAKLLLSLYRSNESVRDMVAAWKEIIGQEAYERHYENMTLDMHVEEAIATLSETTGALPSTFLNRMRALYMRYANRFGWKRKFTDEEVKVLIAEAHRRAMKDAVVKTQPTSVLKAAKAASNPRGPVANAAEIRAAANTYADTVTAEPMLRAAAAATSGTTDDLQGYQTVVGRLMKVAKVGENKLGSMTLRDMKESYRAFALGFQSRGHLARVYGRFFKMLGRKGIETNAIDEVARGDTVRTTVSQVISRLANRTPEQVDTLSEPQQQDFFTLMGATFSQLDPFKRLDAHTHLTASQRVERKAEYDRIVAARDRLGKAGKLDIYREARDMNDAILLQQLTSDLYDRITQNPDVALLVPASKENPIMGFLDDTAIHNDPKKVREFWEARLTQLTDQAVQAIKTLGRRAADKNQGDRINTIVSGIQAQLSENGQSLNAMKQYPYFHLGRFGPYYATFKMPRVRTADGRMVADPRAVEQVAEALHRIGLDNVVVNETTEAATVFIRVEKRSKADNIVRMALELQKTGAVDPAVMPTAGEVDPLQVISESAKRTLEALITEFRAANQPLDSDDAETRKAKADYVARGEADFRKAFLARLPETSASKVMARRGFKAGYDRDMVRSNAQRMQIAGLSAGNRLANDIKNRALKRMIDQVKNAEPENRWAMTSVLREILRREEERPDMAFSGLVDWIVAANHNWFLSMNPGYWLTQITQLQTNVWPELVAGGVSYKRAFEALSGNFPIAFNLVKTAFSEAIDKDFVKYGADATVTGEVLNRVRMSKDPTKDAELKEATLRFFMRGIIDIGSPARELGRVVEAKDDTKLDTIMRWASSGSFYLEMTTRLTTALAAYELGRERGMSMDEAIEYSAKVVDDSMMNYTERNRARMLSRRGLAGQFTPLGTAFLTFQFQMLEKYSRMMSDAFIAGAATPEEARAAKRWLGAHLTAMTALAGVLGLPFVTVVARVIEGMVDLLDDDEEPYNAKAALRNFTADIFGQDVAEVLMRGLPRAAGFDISQRVGAADIMPFTRLMTDRRDWEEVIKELTFNTAGAPLSMVTDIFDGMTKILDGQIIDGMKAALPVALKSPIEAYKIGTTGITDNNGNLLPIEPSTMAIIWQAMGLTPQQRAEYSEANFAQAVRRSVGIREASEIRKKIIRAVQIGDQQAALDAIEEARAFDAASPGFAILPTISASISQAQRRTATAQATGAELGVRPTDIDALGLTRFSNY